MIIVKFTCPLDWNINIPQLKTQFHRMTPGLSGKWEDYEFLINDASEHCDYWFVYGFLERKETVAVRKKTVLLLTEEVAIKVWDKNFMDQFDIVIGSQINVQHNHYIHDHYACGWQVQKSFDQLIALKDVLKPKEFSIIASNTVNTEGHKKRYEFVKKLAEHFGKSTDWFGKGNNFINDKWDGLIDYKFSVAIENQIVNDYWTEKIADCFLAYTIPFYCGCPNIAEYFPQGSYINLDLDDLEKSINIIQETLTTDFYNRNFKDLQQARDLILNKYQLMPKIKEWLIPYDTERLAERIITLNPEYTFVKQNIKERLKQKVYNMLR